MGPFGTGRQSRWARPVSAVSPPPRLRRVPLHEWLRHPDNRELLRAFTDWVRRIAERLLPGGETLAVAEMTLEDMRMTVIERVSEWPKQWVREGREQGMREGLGQGL